MSRLNEGYFQMGIACESDDEIRALYRGLFKARQTERTDIETYRKRLSAGYGTDSDRTMMWRAEAMERMLDRLIGETWGQMVFAKIEPW